MNGVSELSKLIREIAKALRLGRSTREAFRQSYGNNRLPCNNQIPKIESSRLKLIQEVERKKIVLEF